MQIMSAPENEQLFLHRHQKMEKGLLNNAD